MDPEIKESIIETIKSLITEHCDGCRYIYPSFNDHTCQVYPWDLHVCFHLETALEKLNINKTIYTCREIIHEIENS